MLATTPQPHVDYTPIERSDKQPATKKKYRAEIEALYRAGVHPMDYDELANYAASLPMSRRRILKSALRLMTLEYEREVKARSDGSQQVTAALHRLEAMRGAVQVKSHRGTRAHVWLSAGQVRAITARCPETLEGMRDKTVLYLLLGAGLRRQELSDLTFDCLKSVPMKSGKPRDVIEVRHGKGDKSRAIPISAKLADHLRAWQQMINAGPTERVVRAITRAGSLTDSMSAVSLFELTRKYGRMIDVPDLACHDCRRSFAMLGFQSGVSIAQISVTLGHESIQTTQKYLDLHLDVEAPVSDFIPLS